MRTILSLLLICLPIVFHAQTMDSSSSESTVLSTELEWYTNFDKAKKAAKKQRKPMLVYFTGSDWCTPCKKLKGDFFDTIEFKNKSEDFIIVKLDIPHRDDIIPIDEKKQNREDQKKLKVKVFPTLLALDSNGKERNRIERYSFPDPHYYWEFMKKNERIFKL